MDSRKLKLVLNTLLILAFLVVARDYVVLKKKGQTYQSQVTELDDEIESLRKEAADLRARVSKLESDPATIEKEARNRLKMLAPGEVPISLADTETKPMSPISASRPATRKP